MRPYQQSPPPTGAEFNSGLNMLPGYSGEVGEQAIGDTYDPISLNYSPAPSFNPTPSMSPSSPQVRRATPVTDPWRGNAGSFRTRYPAPGQPSMTEPMDAPQGFFAKLLESITGGISGVGDMFENLVPGAAAPRPAPRSVPSPSRGAFGMTGFQSHFPGSLIGPTSGLRTNPYSSSMGPLGGQQQMGGPPPAGAQAFSNVVKARNIA